MRRLGDKGGRSREPCALEGGAVRPEQNVFPGGQKTETIHNTVADTTSQVSLGSTRAQTIGVFPPQDSGLPGRAGVQVYMLRPHPHTHPFVHALTLTHLRHIWNIPEKETTDTAFAWKAEHSPEGEIAGERRN